MEHKQNNSYEQIAENIFQVIPLLKKRLSHMSAFQGEYGMPQSHFQVLSILDERGSMSISEISDYFDIAKPNITPLVDRLVESGLVDRVRSTTDRRVVYVVILDAGRQRLKNIRNQLASNVESWKQILSADDFDRLGQCLDDIFNILTKL